MTPAEREGLERDVRALCEGGRPEEAAERALRGYGPEVYGFLASQHRDEAAAADVFSLWSERLWLGLARFGWECSLRTWAYALARNCSVSYLRSAQRRARREAPVPASDLAARVAQEVRTRTHAFLRTEVKTKMAALRESLSEEDQALLTLRVDRKLEWKDVARVMLAGEGEPEAAALDRESQRLRKRFQIVKERLVEMARREGILGGGSGG
ncbi:MAG TPA: sigma-70 family RNA polymerase sigma factor [Polyangiaceae bacterium]|nr:sigma-70 family RNA polymerase sigma factor [Polyangiaceae bacterium]